MKKLYAIIVVTMVSEVPYTELIAWKMYLNHKIHLTNISSFRHRACILVSLCTWISKSDLFAKSDNLAVSPRSPGVCAMSSGVCWELWYLYKALTTLKAILLTPNNMQKPIFLKQPLVYVSALDVVYWVSGEIYYKHNQARGLHRNFLLLLVFHQPI